ncbi:MAG: hypothetical protein OHK0053_32060 [Microscillaceae bacterium]
MKYLIQVRIYTFVLLTGLLLTTACGGGGKGISEKLVQIPNDVSFVVSMDFKALTSKAKNWKDGLSNFYESLENDPDAPSRELAMKILDSGFDLKERAYIFGKVGAKSKDSYFGATFLLNDPAKLEKAMAELKDKPQVKKEGDIKYIYNKKGDGIFGWKGNTGLLIGGEGLEDEKAALALFKKLFATKASESLGEKNETFRQVNGKSYDIAFWIDQRRLNEINKESLEALVNVSPILSELSQISLYSTGGINFNNGEVLVEGLSILDKEKSKKFEAVLQKSIQGNVVKASPIKNPSAMMGFGLGMNAIYELVKNEESIKQMDTNLQMFELTAKDLFEMMSGDFFLSTADLKVNSFFRKPETEFVLSIGIANEKTLDKLLDKLATLQVLKKQGDYFAVQGPGNVVLAKKDKALHVTLTKSLMDNIMSGRGGLGSDFQKMANGNSFVFYMNIPEIYGQIEVVTGGDPVFKKEIIPQMVAVSIDTKPIKNNQTQSTLKITFKDKSQNSLAIIGEMIKKAQRQNAPVSMR